MKKIVAIILITVSLPLFAQVDTETHRFWQPGVNLTFDDFQGTLSDTAYMHRLTDLHIYHQIATGFWAELDVPDSKRGWKKGLEEKYYFCAAMEKGNSFFLVRDSTELKYAQLIWDICELSTRVSRRNLIKFAEQLNDGLGKKANGGISIQYLTCLNDGKQFGREVTDAFFHDVVTTHNETAYLRYRDMIDKLMTELQEFATTEKEIQRLTSGKPDAGYMPATSLQDDFKGRGVIRY